MSKQISIEVCTNEEWWRVYGADFSEIDETLEEDAASDLSGKIMNALERAGYEVEMAKGQRARCHGWNGANTFARKSGGIGTFDAVADAHWASIEAVVDAAAAAWKGKWEKISREQRAEEEQP